MAATLQLPDRIRVRGAVMMCIGLLTIDTVLHYVVLAASSTLDTQEQKEEALNTHCTGAGVQRWTETEASLAETEASLAACFSVALLLPGYVVMAGRGMR